MILCAKPGKELTPADWDTETAGKTVFIKFLAPWCPWVWFGRGKTRGGVQHKSVARFPTCGSIVEHASTFLGLLRAFRVVGAVGVEVHVACLYQVRPLQEDEAGLGQAVCGVR